MTLGDSCEDVKLQWTGECSDKLCTLTELLTLQHNKDKRIA